MSRHRLIAHYAAALAENLLLFPPALYGEDEKYLRRLAARATENAHRTAQGPQPSTTQE